MDLPYTIITDIELHSVEGIEHCFRNGLNPNTSFRNEPLINELISEYTRSPRFTDCVKAFTTHGLRMEDNALLAVLMDDAQLLTKELNVSPDLISKTYTLRTAYTPIYKATLLHICAEFNLVSCGKLLIENGADINARAGKDSYGFGGQSPVFHTVNQNGDQSAAMLELLLDHGADLSLTVTGFNWGRSYPWETFIPSVNPISYCMMGLLPQMHRDVYVISKTISRLLKHAHGIEYALPNIPNAYLR
jgi:hypothetical protein